MFQPEPGSKELIEHQLYTSLYSSFEQLDKAPYRIIEFIHSKKLREMFDNMNALCQEVTDNNLVEFHLRNSGVFIFIMNVLKKLCVSEKYIQVELRTSGIITNLLDVTEIYINYVQNPHEEESFEKDRDLASPASPNEEGTQEEPPAPAESPSSPPGRAQAGPSPTNPHAKVLPYNFNQDLFLKHLISLLVNFVTQNKKNQQFCFERVCNSREIMGAALKNPDLMKFLLIFIYNSLANRSKLRLGFIKDKYGIKIIKAAFKFLIKENQNQKARDK